MDTYAFVNGNKTAKQELIQIQQRLNEGAIVIISDINDELGQQVSQEIGNDCRYLRLDVQEEGDWESAISSILRDHKKLDILVNNAGITGFYEDAGPQTQIATQTCRIRSK